MAKSIYYFQNEELIEFKTIEFNFENFDHRFWFAKRFERGNVLTYPTPISCKIGLSVMSYRQTLSLYQLGNNDFTNPKRILLLGNSTFVDIFATHLMARV